MNKHSSSDVTQESPPVLEALEAIQEAAALMQACGASAGEDTLEKCLASLASSEAKLANAYATDMSYWILPPVPAAGVSDQHASYLLVMECKTGAVQAGAKDAPEEREQAWQPLWVPIARPAKTPSSSSADAASQSDQIASLRTEVEALKRQLDFLAGLVHSGNKPAADPLAVAKARGASYMKAEFENPDNLSLAAASRYAGRSDRMINLERNRGALYALLLEGNTRGYRYPKWQFDVAAARLRAVLDVLVPGAMSSWALHSFLTRPHADLDNLSPAAALADSTFPIERLVGLARQRVDLHQGAS